MIACGTVSGAVRLGSVSDSDARRGDQISTRRLESPSASSSDGFMDGMRVRSGLKTPILSSLQARGRIEARRRAFGAPTGELSPGGLGRTRLARIRAMGGQESELEILEVSVPKVSARWPRIAADVPAVAALDGLHPPSGRTRVSGTARWRETWHPSMVATLINDVTWPFGRVFLSRMLSTCPLRCGMGGCGHRGEPTSWARGLRNRPVARPGPRRQRDFAHIRLPRGTEPRHSDGRTAVRAPKRAPNGTPTLPPTHPRRTSGQ